MLPAIQPAVVGLDQYQDAAAAPAAALAAAERAASGALSTASTDTGPALAGDLAMLSRGTSLDGSATQEEEELSRELTQEILLEFNGLSTRPASRRSSRRVSLCSSHAASRKPSEALGAASEQGDAQAGDDAAREDGGSDGGSEGTAESDEAEPLPSLYDQLGGGVALKVRCVRCAEGFAGWRSSRRKPVSFGSLLLSGTVRARPASPRPAQQPPAALPLRALPPAPTAGRRPRRPHRPLPPPSKTVLRLQVVVDVLYQHVLGDPRLSPFFEGVDMSKHARKFLLFASYVSVVASARRPGVSQPLARAPRVAGPLSTRGVRRAALRDAACEALGCLRPSAGICALGWGEAGVRCCWGHEAHRTCMPVGCQAPGARRRQAHHPPPPPLPLCLPAFSQVLGGPDEYLQLHPEPWPQLYTVHERLIKNMGAVGGGHGRQGRAGGRAGTARCLRVGGAPRACGQACRGGA